MLNQVARFGGVGVLATLAHVLTALVAERMLQMSGQSANLAGFLTAVLISYFGHANFTFHSGPGSSERFLRFATVSVSGLAASSLTVALITQALGLPFVVAMAAVVIVVPTATYLAMRFWVFRQIAQNSTEAWAGVLLSLGMTLVLALLFGHHPLTNDVAWYLVATREWLNGAPLYEHIMEVNPPLNFYYTVPPILLADHFGLSDTAAQYLFIWVLLFLILCWCSAIIRTDLGYSPVRQAALLVGLAVAMAVPALDSVGQREFYLVLLMTPWLLTQVADKRLPTRREVGTAAVAALGVCLKPHFVLFPAAITLLHILRHRSLRPVFSASNLTFLAIGLAYVGYIALVHPAYLTDIVPIAQLVYGGYRAEPNVVFGLYLREFLLMALPVGLALLDRPRSFAPLPFAAAGLAGFLCYALQAKGFRYHVIPFLSFGLMGCVMVLVQARAIGSLAVACAVAVFGVSAVTASEGFHRSYSVQQAKRVKQELADYDSVMALTTNLGAGPPVAFETGSRWASRYPTNWLIPGALNALAKTDCATEAELCAQFQGIVHRNRSDNIADMIAEEPDLLIVDRYSGYFDVGRFDWLNFMAEDPAWAPVFAEYRKIGESLRYDYYLRRTEKTPP